MLNPRLFHITSQHITSQQLWSLRHRNPLDAAQHLQRQAPLQGTAPELLCGLVVSPQLRKTLLFFKRTRTGNAAHSEKALQVTVVRTALALQQAVDSGAAHIEIQEHLDLGTLDVTLGGLLDHQDREGAVKSIRVSLLALISEYCLIMHLAPVVAPCDVVELWGQMGGFLGGDGAFVPVGAFTGFLLYFLISSACLTISSLWNLSLIHI